LKMPVHAWNWFRAVGVGNDLKSWYGDNPQVEDGREGGNQEFDDDVSGQYEDEVNFMMRRLRLNFYRAEDMMLIYMKKKWAEEDREFKIEQDRRKKEKRERMIKRNKARRVQREQEEKKAEEEKLQQMFKEEEQLRGVLESLFKCPFCKVLLAPPSPIYQCGDGHILCHQCRHSDKFKECPTCDRELAGRNVAMERIASLVFPAGAEGGAEGVAGPSAPVTEE